MEFLYSNPTRIHMEDVDAKLRMHFNKRQSLSVQAQKLQKLLQELKGNKKNDNIWAAVKRLVNNYLGNSLDNALFQTGQDLENWEKGRAFEHEMIALLDVLWDFYSNQLTKAVYTTSKKGHKTINRPMYMGNVYGNVQMNYDDISSIIENFESESKNNSQVNKALKKVLGKNRYGQWVQMPQAREIKTDMYGGKSRSEITLDWRSGDKLVALTALLNNYKISLKNYADLSNVGLGKTQPFKAYAAVLKALDYSDKQIVESYLRAKCCYYNAVTLKSKEHSNHKDSIINTFGKIKSVYELIGLGLISQDGKFKDDVQLIIINQYTSNKNIRVFDTTTLIREMLEGRGMFYINRYGDKTFGRNPFGHEKISISVK